MRELLVIGERPQPLFRHEQAVLLQQSAVHLTHETRLLTENPQPVMQFPACHLDQRHRPSRGTQQDCVLLPGGIPFLRQGGRQRSSHSTGLEIPAFAVRHFK